MSILCISGNHKLFSALIGCMQLMQATKIQKSYRKNHILKNVNLSVGSGSLIGIVGENGSGKTTLLKILAGELNADKGMVLVNGSIGYCPQQPVVNKSLTIAEHFDYFKAAYGMNDLSYTEHLLDELHYHKFKNERVEHLSGGTLQKLNLTLAIMNRPSILLLDEPYQGFDWETYLRFWALLEDLKRNNRAVVVISHLIFEHKKFDQIFHLRNGYVYEEQR